MHTGSLWDSAGQLLATTTFSNETGSGWQTTTFSNPVAIEAGRTYIVSYHTTQDQWINDPYFFISSGVSASHLQALRNGVDGGNGVYRYGTGNVMPASSYLASNYWVDVLFTLGDTTPPQVISQTPAANATGVALNTLVTATFSEAIELGSAHSVMMDLRDGNGVAVAGSWTYDDATKTVTFVPGGLLIASTTYTMTVTSAKDLAGNMMSPVSWSFTTTADTTNPVTSASPSGTAGENGWYRSNVTVTLAASDSESIVASTWYRVGGTGAFQQYAGPFTLSSEGSASVEYYSVDGAGNTETVQSQTIKIDTIAPSITAQRDTAANANGWNNSDVLASYSASDAISGLVPGSEAGSFTFSGEGAGQSHTFIVTDLAGNSASATVSDVSIDKTAPSALVLSSAQVMENQPSATLVGTFSSTDPDLGDSSTYTLISGDGDTDNTLFQIVGNELRTAASFDYEAQPTRSIRVQTTDRAGNFLVQILTIAVIDVDEIAPTVTAVYVRGSSWASGYLSFLAANIAGSSATYGYAIPAGSGDIQLQTLPWRNLNQISLRFSEDVSVSQAQFAIVGSVGSYSVSGFSYSSADHVATWSLSAAIGPDKLYVAVPGTGTSGVRDAAGNVLDGEWNNPTSYSQVGSTDTFPSGNGTAGGDFAFRFDVLPGDSTGGSLGKVNVADVAQTKSRSTLPVTNSSYRSDFDGNNLINVADCGACEEQVHHLFVAGESAGAAGVWFVDAVANASGSYESAAVSGGSALEVGLKVWGGLVTGLSPLHAGEEQDEDLAHQDS